MSEETLGTELSTAKIYYLLFLMGVYLLYFFFIIGMQSDVVYTNQVDKLWFFVWFGLAVGVLPFAIDLIINNNKDLPLDTISYEANSPFEPLNNWVVQVVGSLVLGLLIFFRIQVSGEAFVKAPSFALTIPIISQLGLSDKVVGAFISGITAGVVESIVFFGFVLPTLYAVLRRQQMGMLAASILSGLLATIIFTGYHYWVYGYQFAALWSVFIFGALQALFVFVFRSMIPLFITHFVNNFAVGVFVLSAYVVQVIV